MENKKVTAMIIFEMIGRPAEHLTETINKLIDTVASEKGVKLINRKVHEPKKLQQQEKDQKAIRVEGNPELFSTFCEIEIETQNIMGIIAIAFKYLPAHIELIEPDNFEMTNGDMGFVVNEILLKLHNYDAIAKSAIMQNQRLAGKLKELLTKHPEENMVLKESKVSQKLDYEPEAKQDKVEVKQDKPKKKKL